MPITIGAKRESDFTDPIGMLGDCHRRIERFLNVLVTVAAQEKGGPLAGQDRAVLETSLRYFREAAPKHTADEEESLFPRLRRVDHAGSQAILTRIDSLEQDHACAESAHHEVDRLAQMWLASGRLSPKEALRLSTVLDQLARLYRRHIAIEDTEVFPFAASVLPPSDRESVGAEMAARRGATGRRGAIGAVPCALAASESPQECVQAGEGTWGIGVAVPLLLK
jgi:hemerythrin-like domain-containing protein